MCCAGERGEDQLKSIAEPVIDNLPSSPLRKESDREGSNKSSQLENNMNMNRNLDFSHNKGQLFSTDKLKGKNIMERFFSFKGKERASTSGVLKATSPSTFKSQKSKKLSNKWEKVKILLPIINLNEPMDVRDTGQRELNVNLYNPKPPDLPIFQDEMITRRVGSP